MIYNLQATLKGVITVDKNFKGLLEVMRYAKGLKRTNQKLKIKITDQDGKVYE